MSDVWDIFEKFSYNDKTAVCLWCNKTFSFKSTSHNLKSHARRHKTRPDWKVNVNSPSQIKTQINEAFMNLCYNVTDKAVHCTVCNLFIKRHCDINDIKKHFDSCHNEKYVQVFNEIVTIDNTPNDRVGFKTDDADEESNQEEVLYYYERDTGSRMRCVVCKKTLLNRFNVLRKHLKTNHPKIFNYQTSDESDIEETASKDSNDVFSEIIYVNDEETKESGKTHFTIDRKRLRKSETNENKTKEKSKNEDGLTIFGTYITSLLRKVPEEVCLKLQMDIINLIMNATLNNSENNDASIQSNANCSKILIDTIPVSIQTPGNNTTRTGYILDLGEFKKDVMCNKDISGNNITTLFDLYNTISNKLC